MAADGTGAVERRSGSVGRWAWVGVLIGGLNPQAGVQPDHDPLPDQARVADHLPW
jgi:hypothetical protein